MLLKLNNFIKYFCDFMKIKIINGPNLNLLGKREPAVYGTTSFDGYLEELKSKFPEVTIDYFQSNHEGALIDTLQELLDSDYVGAVINLGAYTHTSIAIADCLAALSLPIVEVHISNIHARESYRHQSYSGAKCKGIITGLGLKGYELAIRYLIEA